MNLFLGAAITFLAPTAGLLGAAIAGPLLILLYFLKLRRRPVRVSSTLLWFDAARDLQVNTPFRVLRFSWLLLLQCLILACFLLALARPAMEVAGSAPQRLVLLIDRSASMSATDVQTGESGPSISRLESAKARARALIGRLPGATEVMLISFASSAQTHVSFSRDRAALRSAIDSISPTDEPGRLSDALRVVQAFTTERSESSDAAPPRVVLLSDGGFESDQAALISGLGETLFDFIQIGPSPDAPKNNVGIVALNARRDLDDPRIVRLFVRLQGVGASERVVPLVIRRDGAPVGASNVTLRAPAVPTALSEQSEVFVLEVPAAGLISITSQLDDALAADNAAAVFVDAPRAPSVLLVQPNTPSTALDYIPIDVLESISPSVFQIETIAEYSRRAQIGSNVAFDLIVFDRVRPSVLPPIPSLSFGAGLPIAGLVATPSSSDSTPAPAPITFWQRTHPIMKFVSLSGVTVWNSLRLELPQNDGSDEETPDVESEVLARAEFGPAIVAIEFQGVRRLVVSFALGESNWWRDPSFPVFIQNAVDYLSGRAPEHSALSFRTGEPVSIRPMPQTERITVTGPVSFERAVPASGQLVSIGALPRVGVYEIGGAVATGSVVPVNLLNEVESAISTSASVRIAGRDEAGGGLSSTAPREIWHWFVVLAIVLLGFEWMIFAWQMRI